MSVYVGRISSLMQQELNRTPSAECTFLAINFSTGLTRARVGLDKRDSIVSKFNNGDWFR